MVERQKPRQSNDAREDSPDLQTEYLSGGWFEWVWLALVLAAAFSAPLLMSDSWNDVTWSEILWGFAAASSVPLACQWVQYAVMRSFGARPKFDWFRITWRSALGSVWTGRDHKFTVEQFATMCQRPFLVVLALTALYVLIAPANGVWLPALLLYVAAEAKRMWFYFVTLRQPSGTLIEEAYDGTVVYRPDASTPY